MNIVTEILQRIWRFFFALNAILIFILLFPFFFVLLQKEKWFPLAFKLNKIWATFILHTTGIFYSVRQEEKLDKNKAYIFCPNHASFLDVILAGRIIPNYFHFMGKAELAEVPLFGMFFRKMNISVERNSLVSSHRAFLRASEDLKKGISILMFPEGGIKELTPPTLSPFKNGPFKLAVAEQVPVVPITFLNNWKIFPDGPFFKTGGRPGIVRVIIHRPIETKSMTGENITVLKNDVFQTIQNTLNANGNK